MMMEECHKRLLSDGSVTLVLRVRPGASKTNLKRILADGSLKIDIAAAPEDGEANAELVRFLAEQFGVPTHNVMLLTGQTSRQKSVRITR